MPLWDCFPAGNEWGGNRTFKTPKITMDTPPKQKF